MHHFNPTIYHIGWIFFLRNYPTLNFTKHGEKNCPNVWIKLEMKKEFWKILPINFANFTHSHG
jgi:hypothetical protein